MAQFEERCGSIRARFMHRGRRFTKTFPDRESAERWVLRTKRTLEIRDAAAVSHLISHLPQRMVKAIAACEYSEDDVVHGRIPAVASCGIYFLILNSRVEYIGKTKDVFLRLSKHRREGKEFDSYNFIPCEPERLDEMESNYIAAFMPTLNGRF